jgi:IS605 OrfB family transposase
MKVVKTINCKIKSHNRIFLPTLEIYREALGFVVTVVNNEWLDISEVDEKKKKLGFVENLIHKTKDNRNPKYPHFDASFYKFPSYFRRAAIADAIGIVSSYRSNYENWELKKEKFEAESKTLRDLPPALSTKHYAFPVFYKGNMFKWLSEDQAMIKLYLDHDWKWLTITLNTKSFKNRNLNGFKIKNPALVKRGKGFELHFPHEKTIQLSKTKLNDQIAVSVDMGLTNSAVCAAIKSDGTVIGRRFIDQPIEKDRMTHWLGRLKKAQRRSCSNSKNSLSNFWRKVNGYQTQIVNDTSRKIVDFAVKYGASMIVFEYLGNFKGPKGKTTYGVRMRQKLQHWAKLRIQTQVENMAHYESIRICRVSPQNTSALAFDGSGKVKRNPKKDLCVFTTGKCYHSDLNATYNIGARYFIREIKKTSSEKSWFESLAKDPRIQIRTSMWTLSTLKQLNACLN